ncbi:MAG: hypothetical protein JEZ06_01575 [Anaerolineaceae bacterium]|nr:hypothetical protein [Anaerolineaceae bacterium]
MSKIHIIPHTHWDREWHRSFQHFRTKLVFVMDRLLEVLEKDADFSHFLLDGQSIVLEDYLAIKPENFDRLKKLVQSGQLIVGPWYIQPDEFAPDGESMIRNLLIGMQIVERFGESMKIGYLPDSFGQSGQLPHILKGFGIESAVIMRGIPAHQIKTSEFVWQGINGEEILGIYLPQGYSNAMFLPKSLTAAKYRLLFTIRKLKKWATTENILIMNGVDHQFPQAHISEIVKKFNNSKARTFTISKLEDYIQDVLSEKPNLPRLHGDLLSPHKNRVHSSIASTRIYQKTENRKMESLLEKYVEPTAVIAWLLGAEYPTDLINQAWKILLQNQTHDGIGGCCTDEVHQEMDQRFIDVKNIAETLQNSYARAIAQRVAGKKLILTVFNNALTRGKQIVRASVFTKGNNFIIKDMNGNIIPYQVEQIEEIDIAQFSIWTLYLNTKEEKKKIDITFEVNFDFNVGCKVFEIIEGKVNPAPEKGITVKNNSFENPYIRVEINKNGSLNIMDKESGLTYSNQHIFEDCGDAGDTYNYSPVMNDEVITSLNAKADFEIQSEGFLKTTAIINLELEVPQCLVDQDQHRSPEKTRIPITTRVSMYPDTKRLDFSTKLNNKARDHRLRVLFPAGIQTEYSYAETQFGTAKRSNTIDTHDWKKQKWSEKPLPIYSQQKFIALNNGEQGLAVVNRGLPEYEIYQGESSTIAITLIRGVGMMGKGDLLIRPGRPSGMEIPTPDAQCLGVHTLEYALYPHQGNLDEAHVPKMAVEFDSPALTVQSELKMNRIMRKFKPLLGLISLENLTSHIFDQIKPVNKKDIKFVSIDNDHLLVSAVKKAEKEDALIIRLYNASDHPIENAEIQLGIAAKKGSFTNFNEDAIEDLNKSERGTYILPLIKPYTAFTTKFTGIH